jgi:hypothetical protein
VTRSILAERSGPYRSRVIGDLEVTDDSGVFAPGRREFLPDTDQATLSCFGDREWNLRPAILDPYTSAVTIVWDAYPPPLLEAAKSFYFALINITEDVPRIPQSTATVISITSIQQERPFLREFLWWLNGKGYTSLAQVTADDLAAYLTQSPRR